MAIGDSWTTRINPRSLGEYRGLSQAGGRFVALSSDGSTDDQVIYSDNAEDWFTATHPASSSFNIWEDAAGNGLGLWVAVAANSQGLPHKDTMYSNDDAENWAFSNETTQDQFKAVLFDGTRFVACGESNTRQIGITTDGLDWTYENTPSTLYNWNGISFDGTTYVIVGVGGATARSTDRVNWTITLASEAVTFRDVTTLSTGNFIAVSQGGTNSIWQTTDSGATWTPIDGTGQWASVTTDGVSSIWVGSQSSTTMRRSTDSGTTWGDITNNISGQEGIVYSSGLLVTASSTAAAATSLSTSGVLGCTILGDPARYISLGEDPTGSRLLTDDEYRLFIKARIAKNQSKGTINSIVDMIAFVVGSTDFAVVDGIDPAEFTVTFDSGALTGNDIIFITQSDLIPKPAGVTLNVVENP